MTEHDALLFSDWNAQARSYAASCHDTLQVHIEEVMPPEKVNFGIPAFGAVIGGGGVSDEGTNGLGQSWSS